MSAGFTYSSGNFVYALTAVAGRGLIAPRSDRWFRGVSPSRVPGSLRPFRYLRSSFPVVSALGDQTGRVEG